MYITLWGGLFIYLWKFLFDFFLGFLSYLFTSSSRDVKVITLKSSRRHYINKFIVTLITCTLGLELGEETHDTYMLDQWVYYTLWQNTGLNSHLHCINQDNHAVCTVSLYRVTGHAIKSLACAHTLSHTWSNLMQSVVCFSGHSNEVLKPPLQTSKMSNKVLGNNGLILTLSTFCSNYA